MILGIGMDIVEIPRVDRMLATHGGRLLERLLTPGEIAYVTSKSVPAPHLAVRLAAKEAAYKALSGNDLARTVGWRDIEVVSRTAAAPELHFHYRAQRRAAEMGVIRVLVTLTHGHLTAAATVILEGP